MTRSLGSRGLPSPVRLSVARELGRDIDGAWWPRVDRITNELPQLVTVLTPMLGDISSINVNWPPLQRPPDFNWPGWEQKRQHVMTIGGTNGVANLLIIPYATYSALAVMLLRSAANLPIETADRDKPAFLTACSILRAAQRQRDPAVADATDGDNHTGGVATRSRRKARRG
ncbi:hypothetical protein MSAS_05170 [Mycobacterium saskatchewanense]|uniref:DUF5994 family protein n=1 Tax=Mycobacterium saskatchewanense TaxID=220927 RepID=UPI00138D3136|nr:DUF5994 family protein [Mycobacterium saskatchewanense]BBX61343.1 hypothetical protein MSAS_05170 [Mycobacterium saskatchewanense]